MVNAAATTVSDPRKTVEESSASTSAALLEQPSMEVSVNEEPELESEVGEIEETVDTPNSHAPTATTQATLLSFNPPIHPGKDLTLENVMDAIAGLFLKVDNFGKQHATLERLVFEDNDARTAVLDMREAKNIYNRDENEELQYIILLLICWLFWMCWNLSST